MRGRGKLSALGALAVIVVLAAAFTSAAQGVHAKGGHPSAGAASCQLGDKGHHTVQMAGVIAAFDNSVIGTRRDQ